MTVTTDVPGRGGQPASRGHNGAGVRTAGGSLHPQAGQRNHGTELEPVRALRHPGGEVRATRMDAVAAHLPVSQTAPTRDRAEPTPRGLSDVRRAERDGGERSTAIHHLDGGEALEVSGRLENDPIGCLAAPGSASIAVVCTVRHGRPWEATCPACLLPWRVVHGRWLAAHGPHVDGRRQRCPGSCVPVREAS